MRDRSHAIERDLAHLADGTLVGSRRELAERLVASSSELQARLREQRRAVAAARSVAQRERAPLGLRMRRRTLREDGGPRQFVGRRRRRRPMLGFGLVGAVGAAVWSLAALGGSQAGLTVAQAATLGARPATVALADPPGDRVTLPGLLAAGLPFPYWEDRFAWRATGARTDRINGRDATTVFYRGGGRLVAYTILDGTSLPAGAGAHTLRSAGTLLTSYSMGDRQVVTWLRRGHTCVLSGRGVSLDAMLKLAAWRGHGQIPY